MRILIKSYDTTKHRNRQSSKIDIKYWETFRAETKALGNRNSTSNRLNHKSSNRCAGNDVPSSSIHPMKSKQINFADWQEKKTTKPGAHKEIGPFGTIYIYTRFLNHITHYCEHCSKISSLNKKFYV